MFLVIETKRKNGDEFIHFIDLQKNLVKDDFKYVIKHMTEYYPNQEITKIYYSRTTL